MFWKECNELIFTGCKLKSILCVFLLALFSCNNKKEKNTTVPVTDSLHFLFSTLITDNGIIIDNHRETKYNSRMAFNDTVFIVSEFGMAHSEYIAVDSTTHVWIRGKEIDNKETYQTVVKKYELKEIDFFNFVNPENDSSFLDKRKQSSINYDTLIARKADNGDMVAYYKLSGDSSIIDVLFKSKNYTFNLPPNKWFWASFQLLDITGDGVDEIFVLNFYPSYWGGEWYIEVYKI